MKKNPQLLILIGAPGSGKTTFAKYQIRTHANWIRVSRDDFRKMQFSNTFLSDEMEDAMTQVLYASIEKILLQKINVIADATHTKIEYLEEYIERFNHLADINFKIFEVPKPELIKRCTLRAEQTGQWFPTKSVTHHYEALNTLKENFDFAARPRVRLLNNFELPNKNLPKAVICDLDGTLSLLDGRDPYDASNADKDRLNQPVASTIAFYRQNGYQILLVSGREVIHREPTLKFLAKHNIKFDQLWMRPSGNYSKDSKLKKDIYEKYIQNNYGVSLVLDDRDQVVDMWRKKLGLPCFQV